MHLIFAAVLDESRYCTKTPFSNVFMFSLFFSLCSLLSAVVEIEKLLQTYFPKECQSNRQRYAAEENVTGGNVGDPTSIPIFCCSVALPGVRAGLHVFEPRYRLMMRRCIESGNRKFGMCLNKQSKYGTVLRILDFEQLADGRSRIECIGEERFRVLAWGEKDGYSTGEVEWIDTTRPTTEVGKELASEEGGESEESEEGKALKEKNEKETQQKLEDAEVAMKVQTIRSGMQRVLHASILSQIVEMLGPMPQDDVTFVFWTASMLSALRVLPEDKLYQLAFGGPTAVVVKESAPEWTTVAEGRPSLLESHAQRVEVLSVYANAVLAAAAEGGEESSDAA